LRQLGHQFSGAIALSLPQALAKRRLGLLDILYSAMVIIQIANCSRPGWSGFNWKTSIEYAKG
jgi:hypothetical protein